MTPPTPSVGNWYRSSSGELFEVVAVDADDETIELQHFDGTLEERDFEAWNELPPIETTAPEDWTGSVDVEPEDNASEADELGIHLTWTAPLEFLDRNETQGYSEWPAPSG
jgi:hypothetical protein